MLTQHKPRTLSLHEAAPMSMFFWVYLLTVLGEAAILCSARVMGRGARPEAVEVPFSGCKPSPTTRSLWLVARKRSSCRPSSSGSFVRIVT